MLRVSSITPTTSLVLVAGALLMLLGGCASSNERTVYVPATSSGRIAAGDPLGMALMNAQGVTKAASVDSSQQWRTQVAFVSSSPGGASPLVEALQGGYVTMASSMPAFARLRDSEVRMPLMTFAATDGPSAD